MTHTYNISGMTCTGCVAKVKSELLKMGDVTQTDVQLKAPQATITMQKHVPIETLQSALQKAGNYTITEADEGMHHVTSTGEESKSWLETYKPILLIFFYVTILSIIAATTVNGFDWMTGMRIFMSGFFLAFSFFKMLDLKGFADNYSSYDIIAKHFRGWGFIYPFIELGLGIAYAINFNPLITNSVTFVVMTVSIIGVLQTVLNKRKIQCACLGAVFNLPMSTVTIIEDALMIAMSGLMLIALL
ncbi:MAG: cation transporter [Chitinophagaceae bacterium]|nr:cation transporter [Chitinophagaceae bacterium]